METPNSVDHWANGTIRLGARDIESLYRSDVHLNSATEDREEALRGKNFQGAASLAQELANPILISGNRTKVTGIAWANVDWACALHYQVNLKIVSFFLLCFMQCLSREREKK